MPLPKRKHSHARTSQRRSNNWKLDAPNVGACPRCHAPRLSHHVCPSCGFYGNRMVVDVRARQRAAEGEGEENAAQE
ncbi:MAG TPA: 50S ribosomal protein L32 [Armatimonadota bacterium]|nr:50S ribosomal protein L32 [Armatimonadota bacterium]